MKSKKYYALAGTNAYGVYTNWGRVVHDRDFVSKHKFKKFGTFESAKTYAEQVYDKFQCGAEEGEYCIDEIKEVNILYQRRDNITYNEFMGTRPMIKAFTINLENM